MGVRFSVSDQVSWNDLSVEYETWVEVRTELEDIFGEDKVKEWVKALAEGGIKVDKIEKVVDKINVENTVGIPEEIKPVSSSGKFAKLREKEGK